MTCRCSVLLLSWFVGLSFMAQSLASVEWTARRTLNLEKPPVDLAFSNNGRWIFVLTEEGTILIYSAEGKLKDQISVGKHVEGIEAGPKDDLLFLTSRKEKTVKEVRLDFIYDIDVSGAPFQGQSDAPVAVAVFNDFQ